MTRSKLKIQSVYTTYDEYSQKLVSLNDKKAQAYLKRLPDEETRGRVFRKREPTKLRFGNELTELTIEFYHKIISLVEAYIVFHPAIKDEHNKELFESRAVECARDFVRDCKWILKFGKEIFEDLDPLLLEQIAGNVFLLFAKKNTQEQMMAWFLMHYNADFYEMPDGEEPEEELK